MGIIIIIIIIINIIFVSYTSEVRYLSSDGVINCMYPHIVETATVNGVSKLIIEYNTMDGRGVSIGSARVTGTKSSDNQVELEKILFTPLNDYPFEIKQSDVIEAEIIEQML